MVYQKQMYLGTPNKDNISIAQGKIQKNIDS